MICIHFNLKTNTFEIKNFKNFNDKAVSIYYNVVIMTHKTKLLKLYNEYPTTYDNTWLAQDPNIAILICIGAGPWKIERRQAVQREAIKWYHDQCVNDLSEITNLPQSVFPLLWQNSFLSSLISNLKRNNLTFRKFLEVIAECIKTTDLEFTHKQFFSYFNCASNSKVLLMFLRDFLNLPAFPIDRHVKRVLVKHKLPVNSFEITKLCLDAGISPNILNRKLFTGKNPDWSNIK